MSPYRSVPGKFRRRLLAVLPPLAWLALCGRAGLGAQQQGGGGEAIFGEVAFEAQAPPFRNATLHVYLEEVTLQDARAKVAGHLILPRVSGGGPQGRPLRFALGEFSPDPGASYNLRAHVAIGAVERKMRGDRVEVLKGDFLSLTRYPVLDAPGKNRLRVEVRLVR